MTLYDAILDEDGLINLAAQLADIVAPGDCILLDGTLGAGKSTFARALIRALTTPDEEVPSPTFTLVQTYDTGRLPIRHYDLYRLEDPSELAELGLDEAQASGLSIIEWPGIALPYLSASRLTVRLAAHEDPERRNITLEGDEAWRIRLRSLPA